MRLSFVKIWSASVPSTLFALTVLASSCNLSSSSESAAKDADTCRNIYDENSECYQGHKGDIYEISKTFDSAVGDQVWTEATEPWTGFKLSLPSGSFAAPMTMTVRLHLNQNDVGSNIEITTDTEVTGNLLLTPPTTVRTRFDVTIWRDIIANYHHTNGSSTTLSSQLEGRRTDNLIITLPGVGRYTFTKRKTPILVKLEIEPEESSVPKGLDTTVVVTGTYADGRKEDVTAKVSWTVANPLITETNADADEYGTFTGLIEGESIITAAVVEDDVSTTGKIIVLPPVVVSIIVTPEDIQMPAGTTQAFIATGTYSDGSEAVITDIAEWLTDDEAILTASNEAATIGVGTGVTPGETFIKAKKDGATGAVKVIVTAPYLVSIAVDQRASEHEHSLTVAITATGTYSDGSTGDVTAEVTWTGDDDAIATVVANSGSVDTLTVGTMNISISVDSVPGTLTDTTTLIVVSQDAVDLAFAVQPTDVIVGGIIENDLGVGANDGATYLKGQFMHPDVKVSAVDGAGNVDKKYTGDITIALSDFVPAVDATHPAPTFDLATSITVAAVEGVATFGYIRIMENCDPENDGTDTSVDPVDCDMADTDLQNFTALVDIHTTLKIKATADGLTEILSDPFNSVVPAFPSGDGDTGSAGAYEIATMEELDRARLFLDKDYVVSASLDASAAANDWHEGNGIMPIGFDKGLRTGASNIYENAGRSKYTGEFDGAGFNFENFKIDSNDVSILGLFSKNAGKIHHLNLLNININAPSIAPVGGLAGENVGDGTDSTKIYNVKVTGTIVGQKSVGGISGVNTNNADIYDVVVDADITASLGDIGGITGLADNSSNNTTITRCLVTGTITSTGGTEGVGGIVGTSAANISECAFNGTILGQTKAGGIVGSTFAATSTISYNVSRADVQAASASGASAGGFVGVLGDGALSHNASLGNVTTPNQSGAGGFVGEFNGTGTGSISHSLSQGNIWSKAYPAGGFAAKFSNNGTKTIDYSGALATLYSPLVEADPLFGTFIGQFSSSDTVEHVSAIKHSDNPTKCAVDVGDSETCLIAETGYLPRYKGIGFKHVYHSGRKVGFSDQSSYKIAGPCSLADHGASVIITVTDAAATLVTATTTCSYGAYSDSLNLSSLADGNLTATVTLALESCTVGDDCDEASLSLTKETVFCADEPSVGDYAGGAGSSGDPYLICTELQLDAVRNNLGSYFRLKNNIASSGVLLVPIGTAGDFTGGFDGDGHVIKDLTMFRPDQNNAGLFGVLNLAGEIVNLTIEDASIMGASSVGILAGRMNSDSNITNVAVSGVVLSTNSTNNNDSAGGLVGSLNDCLVVSKVTVDAGVVGKTKVGMVAGYASGCDLSEVATYGAVVSEGDGTNSYAGGVVGQASAVNFSQIASFASVTAADDYAGGIAGQAVSATTITDSFAQGTITGAGTHLAGLVGNHSGGTISNVYASGTVIGSAIRGGLVGELTGGATIEDSFATSLIAGPASTTNNGGMFGLFESGTAASDNFFYDGTDHLSAMDGTASTQTPTCTPESTLATFYNAANAPMSEWSFSGGSPLWTSSSTLPTLTFLP